MTRENLYCQVIETPIGVLVVVANEDTICSVQLLESGNVQPEGRPSILTAKACKQMTKYFAGKLKTFDLPLAIVGTDFQQLIWQQLLTIPYGKTISYGDLAEQIGNKKAVRAVGAANGKNPIPIIVPCHRVIAANGKLQGFALGLDVKRYLLNLEYHKPEGLLF